MEMPFNPDRKLTYAERMEHRYSMMEELDEYLKEMVLYCDDEEDLIAMGSMLQIHSKNILTSCMNKKDWKHIIQNFAADVEKERDHGSMLRKYRGKFY